MLVDGPQINKIEILGSEDQENPVKCKLDPTVAFLKNYNYAVF